jgi:hypothetical protein
MLSICYKKWRLNSSFLSDSGILETKEIGEFHSSFPSGFEFNAIPAPYTTQDMLDLLERCITPCYQLHVKPLNLRKWSTCKIGVVLHLKG